MLLKNWIMRNYELYREFSQRLWHMSIRNLLFMLLVLAISYALIKVFYMMVDILFIILFIYLGIIIIYKSFWGIRYEE